MGKQLCQQSASSLPPQPQTNCLPSWWRWIVLAATFYMNAIVNGYTYCFGLLKIHLEEEYPGVSPMLMASIGGAIASVDMLFAPLAIATQEYFGARVTTIGASVLSSACFLITWLNGLFFHGGFFLDLLTLGVGQGVAFGFLYGPSVAVLPNYFPINQIAFAAGVANAGTSFGIIVFGFMTNPLFNAYGWRGALLFYAIFNLHGVLAAMAFVPAVPGVTKATTVKRRQEPMKTFIEMQRSVIRQLSRQVSTKVEDLITETSKQPWKADLGQISVIEDRKEVVAVEMKQPEVDSKKQSFLQVLGRFFDLNLFRQWPFVMMLSAAAFSITGYFVPSLLVPGQAKDLRYGVTPSIASIIMTIFGVLNLTGRIMIGRIGDLGCRYAIFTSYSLYIASLVISATAMFIFPHVMWLGNAAFVSFVTIYGFAAAPIITMRSVLTINLFGKNNASAAYGWFVCAQGAVQMAGFIIPAWLNSNIGPVAAYSFAGSSFIIAAFSCAVTAKPFFNERRKQITELANAT